MSRASLAIIVFVSVVCALPVLAQQPSNVQFFNSGKVMPSTLPFSEAVRVDNTLYLSGQLGVIPGTLELVKGGLKEESRQTMENIKTLLEAHGYTMHDLVKCTVMLADMSEWPAFNEIYRTFFSGRYPARSAFGVTGLALGARVEVECIAVLSSQQGRAPARGARPGES